MATTLIAAYAAVVATLSLALSTVLAIAELRRHSPQVKVTAKHGKIVDAVRGSSESLIFIEAVNMGAGTISITGVGWLLSDKTRLHIVQPLYLPLPAELRERRKVSTHWPCRFYRDHKDRDKIIAAYFQDETGRLWTGRIESNQKRIWKDASNGGWKVV